VPAGIQGILNGVNELDFLSKKRCDAFSIHILSVQPTQFTLALHRKVVSFRFPSHLHDFLTFPPSNQLRLVLFDDNGLIVEKLNLSRVSSDSKTLQCSIPRHLQLHFVSMKERTREGYPLYAVLIKEVVTQTPAPLARTYLLFYDGWLGVFWKQKPQGKPSLWKKLLNWLRRGDKR